MKIYGVNISHDTSLAVIEDGVVTQVYEEERSRREKYFDFSKETDGDHGLVLVEHKHLDTPDELVFASFDRRSVQLEFNKDLLRFNRKEQDPVVVEFAREQLTTERLKEIAEEHPSWFTLDDNTNENGMADKDFELCEDIAKQIGIEDYFFDFEHHLYHAESGYTLSPWKDEPCIAITWDGGGAITHFDTHPNYQEIESIWRCEPNTSPKPQWKRYSNHRFLGEIHNQSFVNYLDDCFVCQEDVTETIDGVESVFTSLPSMGMNFSNVSYALGCDDMGRAAGKVMGMASYGSQGVMGGVFNRHTIAQELELQAFETYCTIIQRAIDLNPDTNKIILSGGFSLNCTNNYKYLERFPTHQFFVDPVPHDGGTAVGAASILYRNIMEGTDVSTEEGEENVAD